MKKLSNFFTNFVKSKQINSVLTVFFVFFTIISLILTIIFFIVNTKYVVLTISFVIVGLSLCYSLVVIKKLLHCQEALDAATQYTHALEEENREYKTHTDVFLNDPDVKKLMAKKYASITTG